MSLPSGLPEIVDDTECVSRFARHKTQYYKQDPKRAKPTLFDPVKGVAKLSVSRTSTLEKGAVEQLGISIVSKAGHTLKGWCDIRVKRIRSIKIIDLDVVPDERGNNHFHAHIEHMPLHTDKSYQLEVCNELAEIAEDFEVI